MREELLNIENEVYRLRGIINKHIVMKIDEKDQEKINNINQTIEELENKIENLFNKYDLIEKEQESEQLNSHINFDDEKIKINIEKEAYRLRGEVNKQIIKKIDEKDQEEIEKIEQYIERLEKQIEECYMDYDLVGTDEGKGLAYKYIDREVERAEIEKEREKQYEQPNNTKVLRTASEALNTQLNEEINELKQNLINTSFKVLEKNFQESYSKKNDYVKEVEKDTKEQIIIQQLVDNLEEQIETLYQDYDSIGTEQGKKLYSKYLKEYNGLTENKEEIQKETVKKEEKTSELESQIQQVDKSQYVFVPFKEYMKKYVEDYKNDARKPSKAISNLAKEINTREQGKIVSNNNSIQETNKLDGNRGNGRWVK